MPRQKLLEIRPVQKLHDDEWAVVDGRAHIQHARHVIALDLERGSRLRRETTDGVLADEEFRSQKLEGDASSQLEVGRLDHEANATRPDEPENLVLSSDHVSQIEREGQRIYRKGLDVARRHGNSFSRALQQG